MTRHTSIARRAGDALLWAGGIAGAACAILAIAAALFGIRVMLFSTGSMEPTIPTGSAAVVAPVVAADLRIGDIATVDRGEGELPITHRIVSIAASDSPDARQITMRGDANDENDPSPYDVTTAGRVLFSVPGVAPAIAAFGSPRILGPVAILAAGFVIWGLWPRRRTS